jgi:hypothetical protein
MQNLHEPAIKELESKLEEILAQAEGFRSSIEVLKSLTANGIISKVATISNVSKPGVLSLVEQTLRSLNRFVKIHQIAAAANLDNAKVRSSITTLQADDIVTKVQVTTSNGDTFWGLKGWKDANGAVKSEYMYDETELLGRKMKI